MAQYKTKEGPKEVTSDRLFRFMVDRARFEDRIYFCSDTTAPIRRRPWRTIA